MMVGYVINTLSRAGRGFNFVAYLSCILVLFLFLSSTSAAASALPSDSPASYGQYSCQYNSTIDDEYNLSELENISILGYQGLTAEDFEIELEKDPELKDLYEYAGELGYTSYFSINKETYEDGKELTTILLYSDDEEFIFLFSLTQGDNKETALMKLEDNDSMILFNREAWMRIDGDSVSEWAEHHSCNKVFCIASCMKDKSKLFKDVVDSAKDVLDKIGDVEKKLGECALRCPHYTICGIATSCWAGAAWICSGCGVAVASTPSGVAILAVTPACGSCLAAGGGCTAALYLCGQAYLNSNSLDCADCAYELFDKAREVKDAIKKFGDANKKLADAVAKCTSDCLSCPSSYGYYGNTCHPTRECGVDPAQRNTRLGCGDYPIITNPYCTNTQFPNAVYNEVETCDDCEWEWEKVGSPVEICGTDEVCVAGACVPVAQRLPCDDMNLCTIDDCDPLTGNCTNTPKNCSDNNACTIDDCNLANGNCDYQPKDCNDNNLCTIDDCDPASGCKNIMRNCDDGDSCTMDSCNPRTGGCVHRPIAGCGTPDDNYDVSTVDSSPYPNQSTARQPEIAILHVGNALLLQKLLSDVGESSTLVDVGFSVEELEEYPVFMIPSGGLYGLDLVQSFKSKLEEYTADGGTIIAFAQEHGYEFEALPGGDLSGYGWVEDQACHHNSVGITTYHHIISGQEGTTSSVSVDGYFTSWPDESTIVLSRTKNGMPALLLYGYGNGTVIATSAYSDWSHSNHQAGLEEKKLVQNMVAWAKHSKNGEEMPLYSPTDTVEESFDLINIDNPVSTEDYPQFDQGDTVHISFNVTNFGDIPSNKLVVEIFDPSYGTEQVNYSLPLEPEETMLFDFNYNTANESLNGTYLVFYSLYDDEIPVSSGLGGLFGLGIGESDLSESYNVTLILINPAREVVKNESVLVDIEAGGVETIDFTYPNPSELGIWDLNYIVSDLNGTLIFAATKQFAVSNYAGNPGGFVYPGKEIDFGVNSDAEYYVYGSKGTFTFTVWNHADSEKNVTVWWSFPHDYWKTYNLSYGGPGTTSPGHSSNLRRTLAVPPNGQANFTYTVPVYSYDRAWVEFYEGDESSNEKLGRASKGFYTYYPTLDVKFESPEDTLLSIENVSLPLNITNKQGQEYDVSVIVTVFDSTGKRVAENVSDLHLDSRASQIHMSQLSLPLNSQSGRYRATAIVSSGGRKLGFASLYFRLYTKYGFELGFDKPIDEYKTRDNMSLEFMIKNQGSEPWSSIINISIPSISVTDSFFVSLDPDQTENSTHEVYIPATASAGKHYVIVDIGFVNETMRGGYFILAEPKLVLDPEEKEYSAGEPLLFNLSNTGGTDTTYECNMYLYDRKKLRLNDVTSLTNDIMAGETRVLELGIPSQTLSGDYNVFVRCEDLVTGEKALFSQTYAIGGLKSGLTSVTDKKIYFNTDMVSILTNITNHDGPISDSILDLKISSVASEPKSGIEELWNVTALHSFPFGDIDGDRSVDVMTYSYGSPTQSQITLISGQDAQQIYNISTEELLLAIPAGDLDGDGDPDLLLYNNVSENSTNLLQIIAARGYNGETIWEETMPFDLLDAIKWPHVVPTGDLDGDGINDVFESTFDEYNEVTTLVARKGYNGEVLWNDSNYTFAMPSAAGDVDGDGNNDVLVYSSISDIFLVEVVTKKGYNGETICLVEEGIMPLVMQAGDLDGDGAQDLLVYKYNEENYSWTVKAKRGYDCGLLWEQEMLATPLDSKWLPVAPAGDLDANGKDDVIAIFLSNESNSSPLPTTTTAVSSLDLEPGEILIVAMEGDTGDAIWNESSFEMMFATPAGDLDGNGINDVIIYGGYGYAGDPLNISGHAGNNGQVQWTYTLDDYLIYDIMLPGLSVFMEYGSEYLWFYSAILWAYDVSWNYDLNGDGLNDVIFETGDEIHALAPYGMEGEAGTLLWRANSSLNISESDIRETTTVLDIENDLQGKTGKMKLVATFYNSLTQTINQSTYYFFVTDTDTALILETDKQIYKPGETITISGEVINNAEIPRDYELLLYSGESEIFSDSFTLDPNQSQSFTTTTSSESSFMLEGTTGDTTVVDFITIEEPQADLSIIAPDVVGISLFEVGILVENMANVSADLTITLGAEVWDITLPANEATLLGTIMSITNDTTISVSMDGDVEKTVLKEITCGENVTINVTPPPTDMAGLVEIPFTLNNVGLLDSEFDVVFSVDGDTVQKNFFVPVNDSINSSISFNLTEGQHLLEYQTPFEEGALFLNILLPANISLSSIYPKTMETTGFGVGERVNLSFELENTGGIEGEVTINLSVLEFEDAIIEWVSPGQKVNVSFEFMIPEDLEAKAYPGYYEINGEPGEFSFPVYGINLSVNAGLDKDLYEEGETALLTIEILNQCPECNLSSTFYARAKLGDYDETQYFNLTDSETVQFSVPVQFNGQKLFYGIYKDTGRSIYLNALYLYEKESIELYTDKQVYYPGETVTVFVTVPYSGTLEVTAPGLNDSMPISGQTSFDFTLPIEMRSGTYLIEYSFDNQSYQYQFDVDGYSVEITEANLNKAFYNISDTIEANLTIKTNLDLLGEVRLQVLDLDYNIMETFEVSRQFLAGENKVNASSPFMASSPGIKILSYSVYTANGLLLASGEDYFEVRWDCKDWDGDGYNVTEFCGPVDCNDNDPSVNPGANESCNDIDDNCNGLVDEGGNDLCDDGLFCNGIEICYGTCISGTPLDCSVNDIPTIGTCDYVPDNNSATWDYFEGFTSECNDLVDQCTAGDIELLHTCDMENCAAECVVDEDCEENSCSSLDGCYQGIYRTYEDSENICLENCSCEHSECLNYAEEPDNDGDTYSASCGDCDDSDPLVNSNAPEICDDVDNNCNGVIDEGCATPASLKQDSIELLEDSKTDPPSCDSGNLIERFNCLREVLRILLRNWFIDGIIYEITSSLTDGYWTDATTLDSQDGAFVFIHEERAVSGCSIDMMGEVCDAVTDNLVDADAELAETALSMAENTDVVNEENLACYESAVDTAYGKIEQAETASPPTAIGYYRDSWESSQKAIEYAESAADICN